MVVARNRSPQTTQRMFDFSGGEAEKPESGRLAVLIDISCNSSVNVGLTGAPDCSCYGKFGARGVEEEDSLWWAVGVKRHHGVFSYHSRLQNLYPNPGLWPCVNLEDLRLMQPVLGEPRARYHR